MKNIYELIAIVAIGLASALFGYYIGQSSPDNDYVSANYWFDKGYIAGNNRVILNISMGKPVELLKNR